MEQLDDATKEVEDAMIAFIAKKKSEGVEANVQKSFQDAINQRILGDIPKVIGSFVLMFLYVSCNLGDVFHPIKNRIHLSQVGLFSVLLALISSYGLCSYLGFLISPLHNFIPFLLLGLGVDDMFVIVQAHDFYTKSDDEVKKRISIAMKHSGAAITVTSLTDFLAFAIGGTTTIPALRSFCFFCGIGIFCVYIFQATLFVAFLSLDDRRRADNRNALVPCIKSSADQCCECKPIPSCRPIKNYGIFLSKLPVQTFIIVVTAGMLGLSIYGNYELKQEFDPWMFLPNEDPVKVWKRQHDEFFPSKGEPVLIISEGESPLNLTQISTLLSDIEAQNDIVTEMEAWYLDFQKYHEANFGPLLTQDWDSVQSRLVQFLFSSKGARYQYMFNFQKEPQCGGTLPKINTHIMQFRHSKINNSIVGIEAMNRIKSIIKSTKFNTRVFAFSALYSVWEIDEIIRGQLYRNLGFATLAIYIATLLLLSDIRGSIFCLLSVLLTLTNVSGVMYFWGEFEKF